MSNFHSMIQYLSEVLLIQQLLFSLAGTIVGSVIICFPGISRLAALTLIFFIQIVVGLPPSSFILFAVAGFVAVLLNAQQGRTKRSQPALIVGRWPLLLLVVAVLTVGLFRAEIAEFIIQSKSVGMIHLLVIVLVANLLFSQQPFGKSLIALSLGMLTAHLGAYLTTRSLHLPLDIISSIEGIDLLIVLAGVCLFAPIFSARPPEPSATTLSNNRVPLINIASIFALLVFGIGTTAVSIVMFAMLNYESVAFGALTSFENTAKMNGPLLSILFSIAIVLITKNNLTKRVRQFLTKTPHWVIQSSLAVFSVAVILISGLGLASVYLALFFGLIGMTLEKSRVPTSLFVIGFIYGSHFEYLIKISTLTNQNLLERPTAIAVLLAISLVPLCKAYWMGRNENRA